MNPNFHNTQSRRRRRNSKEHQQGDNHGHSSGWSSTYESPVRACYRCQQPGHIARVCPSICSGSALLGTAQRRGHYDCQGVPGYEYSDCRPPNNSLTQLHCILCNELGHSEHNCRSASNISPCFFPSPRHPYNFYANDHQGYFPMPSSFASSPPTFKDMAPTNPHVVCFSCTQVGHKSMTCPLRQQLSTGSRHAQRRASDQGENFLQLCEFNTLEGGSQLICHQCSRLGHTTWQCSWYSPI